MLIHIDDKSDELREKERLQEAERQEALLRMREEQAQTAKKVQVRLE